MHRRDFLGTGIAMAGALALRPANSRFRVVTRGAIVIGVDKPGQVQPLRAAASGAYAVGDLLTKEGFEVKRFVDDQTKVTAQGVYDAVKAFVDLGTLEQLVIYFAGHGFISGTSSEFWMLSDAPENPNEAISLNESCKRAEISGIPNVVFISDACRSRAESLSAERMSGYVIFPDGGRGNHISDVDQFLATRVGYSAYEAAVMSSAATYEGIYTSCFLDAFRAPYATMVETVQGKGVVPNRRLKRYLSQEVPKRARARNITLDQQPDSRVLSDEPTYIAHVSGTDRTSEGPGGPTIGDVAREAVLSELDLSGVVLAGKPPFSKDALNAVADSSGFQRVTSTVRARGLPSEFLARTGFTIFGQRVQRIVTRPGIHTDFANSPESAPPSARIEVDVPPYNGSGVAVRFANGSGTVLAAIGGYAGSVLVDEGRVTNVSYLPTHDKPSGSEAERLERLRAAVAAAARFGVFRFDGPKATRETEARRLADRIRVLKGVDPTLGIYAAYAYADAGLRDQVHSVRVILRDTIGVDLFDIALLDGDVPALQADRRRLVPWCPMLSQGWGLLRVKNVRLPGSLPAATDHLRVSLWMTLDAEGMTLVEREVEGR